MNWNFEQDTLEFESQDFSAHGHAAPISVGAVVIIVNKFLKNWFDKQPRMFRQNGMAWGREEFKGDTEAALLIGIKPIKPLTERQALEDLLKCISTCEFEHGDRFTVGVNDQASAKKAIEAARKVLAK